MYRILIAIVLTLVAMPSLATVYMTQQEALHSAFPGTPMQRQSVFLTDAQLQTVRQASGVEEVSAHIVRYVAMRGGKITGFVYFDAHRVRTLPETIMVVVSPDGVVQKIEIISFNEPVDYLPKRRWLDQVHGKKLNRDLSLNGAIRPISGATLSGRAIVQASRKILSIHQALAAQPLVAGAAATSSK